MPDEQMLFELLEALYAAPLDSSRWKDFLRLTAVAAGGEAAALLMHDFSNAESAMSVDWGFHPEVAQLYAAHYGAIDVWRRAVTSSSDWIGTSERFVPQGALARTEFYNDLLLPYGIPHGMFAMIERGPTRVANLSICRGAQAGAFEERNVGTIKFLKPHIQRAYRLHSELGAAYARDVELLAGLDAISSAVILISSTMQVITMNRVAEHLVAAKNGLRVDRKRLCAQRAAETTRLQKALTEAVTTSEGKGLESAGSVKISRCDLPPLQLLICPIRGFECGIAAPVRAVVFINDPNQRARLPLAALQTIFGLTTAERKVASRIVAGEGPNQIAEALGVTRNTVKSQLASIYSKTQTSRQSQLIRLLLQLAMPELPAND